MTTTAEGGMTEETTEEATEETTEETTTEGLETTEDPYAAVQEGNAVLRVAHLSPNAPNVDVAVAGSTVLTDVAFKSVSGYLVAPPGSYQITITPTGGDTPVFDQEVTLENAAYTAVALGEVNPSDQQRQFRVRLFEDSLQPPSNGMSKVRLVHAAPDAPDVDVTVEGTDVVLFDGLSFRRASRFRTVDAGQYTLEIRPDTEANDGDVVTTVDVTLESGRVYTAFAAGYLDPADAPADQPFTVLLSTDQGAAGTTTTTTGTGTGTGTGTSTGTNTTTM